MVWYCVLTSFVGVIFNSLSEYVRVAESEADKLQCFAFFFLILKKGCKMEQFCIHPLTPKICLLIIPSSCCTFPCTVVIMKGRTDSNRKLLNGKLHGWRTVNKWSLKHSNSLPDHSNGWINYLNIQTDVTILQTDANVF